MPIKLIIEAAEAAVGQWANYCLTIDGRKVVWAATLPPLDTTKALGLVHEFSPQASHARITVQEGCELAKLAMETTVTPLHTSTASSDLPTPQA